MKETTREALGAVLMLVGAIAYYLPILLIVVIGVFFPVIMLVVVPGFLVWSTFAWIFRAGRH